MTFLQKSDKINQKKLQKVYDVAINLNDDAKFFIWSIR